MALTDEEKKILFETAIKVDNLTNRANHHSERLDNLCEILNHKIDELIRRQAQDKEEVLQRIGTVEKEGLKESHKLDVKIALLVGGIGIFSGGIGSMIQGILMKGH